jgi:ATP phosphoribosyltransferase
LVGYIRWTVRAIVTQGAAKLVEPWASDRADGLVLALPKGRFLEKSLAIVRAIGASLDPKGSRVASSETLFAGHTIRVKVLKIQDVASLLKAGIADFGVCSDEWMSEFRVEIPSLVDLGWCRTSVVLASPRGALDRPGVLRIATPYPRLAQSFLEEGGRQYQILPMLGCPEALVPDVCDAMIDCVETGRSLRENDLVSRVTLLESSIRFYHQPAHNGSALVEALANVVSTQADLPISSG